MERNESFLYAFLRPHLGDSEEQVALDDQIWMDWLKADGEQRNQRDFLELLDSDARDVFKIRALAVLIAPDAESYDLLNAPDQDLIEVEIPDSDTFDELSEDLLVFLGELTCCCFDFLASRDESNDTNVQAMMRDYYPWLICELLEMLPADHSVAEQLFERFPFLSDMENESAFCVFMGRGRIPDERKTRLDQKMRCVINAGLKERDPKVVNLARENNRIRYYIQSLRSRDFLDELWSSQVEYLLDLPVHGVASIFFEGQDFYSMFSRLLGDKHRSVRCKFATVFIKEGFLDTLDLADRRFKDLAMQITQDLSDQEEIVSLLNDRLEQHHRLCQAPRRQDAQRRERINAALARMQ